MARNFAKPLAAAAIVALLASPVFADELAPVTKTGDQSFEVHDPADTPPVNYRSEEDSRYDTAKQHDAEMYAEQYEQKRIEDQLEQKKLLNMNTLSAPGGPINSDLGANDAGFPAKAPY
ncbi:MAG TPA: hypothetical protein VGN05_15150 [Parvibaculum sp.]